MHSRLSTDDEASLYHSLGRRHVSLNSCIFFLCSQLSLSLLQAALLLLLSILLSLPGGMDSRECVILPAAKKKYERCCHTLMMHVYLYMQMKKEISLMWNFSDTLVAKECRNEREGEKKKMWSTTI